MLEEDNVEIGEILECKKSNLSPEEKLNKRSKKGDIVDEKEIYKCSRNYTGIYLN